MNIFFIFLMYALNGSTFTISKILVTLASPIFLVGIRMLIAGTMLLIYHRLIQGKSFGVPRGAIKYLLQSIICNIFIPYCLRYWAIQYVTGTKTAFFYNLAPFITHAIACAIGMERGSWKKSIGLAIGFLSILPILISGSYAEDLLGGISFISLPELALLGTIISYSYSWIVVQKMVRKYKLSPFLINGINMFFGGALAIGTSFILGESTTITSPVEFTFWMATIMIITNFICYNLYAILLKKFSSTLISFASLTMPFFAALTGWLYYKETVSWHNFAATILTFIGLYIFYKAETKKNTIPIVDIET